MRLREIQQACLPVQEMLCLKHWVIDSAAILDLSLCTLQKLTNRTSSVNYYASDKCDNRGSLQQVVTINQSG
jgi:hypothetical protein